MSQAALVLVGTPIGNLGDLSPRAVQELRAADALAAEDTRRLRKLLSHSGVPAPRRLLAVHEHNERQMTDRIVELVRSGFRVAYVTDAGMPGVADPGERLVRAVSGAGLRVELVPGPSAALAGLVLSGLPAERFVFEGFLPGKGRQRGERVEAIGRETRTVVLFEAPHRLAKTLAELEGALGGVRQVAVARELTKLHEEVWRGTLAEAAARARETEPRGEHVIVVAGRPSDDEVDDSALTDALAVQLGAGASTRDAAAAVAARFGVSRRRVYELAVSLGGAGEPSG